MNNEHISYTPGTSNAPVIMLHGTGGDENDLLPIANVLFPEQPKIGIRGRLMEQGLTRYFAHRPDGSFDQTSLENETQWLMATIAEVIETYQLDDESVTVLGYSNGANMALYAALTGRTFFKTAILLHPMLVSDDFSDDIADDVNLWASYGDNDPIVTPENFSSLVSEAEKRYFNLSTFKSNMGHAITKEEILDAAKWLHAQQ